MSRMRIRLSTAQLKIRVAQATSQDALPTETGAFSLSGSATFMTDPSGGGDAVVFDAESATLNTLLVGSAPGEHGFHFQHEHPEELPYPHAAENVFSGPGNWSDTTKWSQGRLPDASDDVVRIPAGLPLVFDPGANRTLEFTNFLINHDGEARADFSGTSNTLTLVGRDVALDLERDPYQWGNAFWCLGKARFTGAAKTPWVEIDDVAAEATTITVRSAVTGWQVGDQLVFEDTRQFYYQISLDFPGYHEEFEVVTITEVDGDTVTFTPALSYAHFGPRKKDTSQPHYTAVMNITRNIVLKSANRDGARLHSGAHGRADVEVLYCEAQDTGRSHNGLFDDTLPLDPADGPVTHVGTNQRGRYGGFLAHLHHYLGPVRNATEQADADVWQGKLVGCSSWNRAMADPTKLPRWGLGNVHSAHWCLLQSNVGFRHAGSHMIGEAGNERANLIDGNFMIHSPHVLQAENTRGAGDVAFASVGIWVRGADNRITNNRVNGVSRCYIIAPGISFSPEGFQFPLWKSADPTADGESETLNIRRVPIREFRGNTGGGACYRFFEIWDLGDTNEGQQGHPGMAESVVEDCVSWHLYELACYNYRDGEVTFDNYRGYQNFALLAAQSGGGVGFFANDYVTENLKLKSCELHGFIVGIDVGPISVAQSIENSHFCCYWGVLSTPPWIANNPASVLVGRTLTVANCTFEDALASDIAHYGPQAGIKRNAFIRESGGNITDLTKLDKVVVTDFDGTPGDDFNLYYPEQSGDAIFRQSTQFIVGCPAAGKTNTQSLADHGVCWGAEIAPPESTTRAKVIGLCEAV